MDEFSFENIPIELQDLTDIDTNAAEVSDSGDELDEGATDGTKKIIKRNPSKLSPHLKGLMGEANLRFARGELELAKKMCFEVIRQAPEAFEPYLTLAQMYENNNFKKYKAFLMLAGHLQPSNANIWCRLADLELQENQTKAAISYYSKAIKAEPHNIELHMKRMVLVQKRDNEQNKKGILHCKLQLAKALPQHKHEQIINICNEVAKEYYQAQNYIRAIDALRIPIKRIPDKTNQNLLNMMLELLLLSERYSECLDIFTQFFGFNFDVTVDENMVIIVNSYSLPENLHVDIKTKFIVCLIRLQCQHLVAPLVQEMLEKEDIESYGMLFFDIAEALVASSCYREALQLLVPLIKSKSHSLAAVWLKHAECLVACEMFEEAIEAYFTVMSLAPNHVDVLYPLAILLIKLDRKEQALEVLSQDISSGKLHVALLIEQMRLLKQIGDLKNYWMCCELLLSRHCIVFKNYEELKIAISMSMTVKEKLNKITRCRKFRGQETSDIECNLETKFEPSVEDEFKLYKEILQFAYEQKEYMLFQKFSFMGLVSKKFVKHFSDIYLVACYACLFNKDIYHGYILVRELLVRHMHNNEIWNIYSLMLHIMEETRNCHRFFEASSVQKRMPAKNKELLLGNYFCSVGNYSECFSYFLKQSETSTYALFMIGVCVLQQYCQRHTNKTQKKFMVETATYLFLNYAKIRSKHAKHEAYYNLGRMYQQIGVFYLAEFYYKKVLEQRSEILEELLDVLGLKEEAAYNLHLIYKKSGNLQAARKILMQHVVI